MEPVSREQIVAIIRQRADRLRDAEVRAVGLQDFMNNRRHHNRLRAYEVRRERLQARNIDPAINGQRDPIPPVEPRERGDRGLPEFWPVGEQAVRPRAPPVPPPVPGVPHIVAGIRNPDQLQGVAQRPVDPLGGHPVMFLGERNGRRVDHPNQRMQEIERDHADRVGRLNALGVALEDAQRLRRAQGGPLRAEHGPLFRQATIPSDEDDGGSQVARTTINISVEGDIVSYASSPDQPSSVGLFIWGKFLK